MKLQHDLQNKDKVITNLSCFVVNARSLKKNNAIQLLHTDLLSNNADFAAVTEM